MDKIDVGASLAGERRDRFFARSVGTSFDVRSAEAGTTIDLYDEIGWFGTTASDFRARLKDATGDITLRINSPGGDVFDGIGIYNDLLAYDGRVRVEIVGLAASIASIIAMAGDEVVMAPNAMMMIHDSWTIGMGNRHDFADVATVLGKIDDALARTYAARTKTGIRQIKTWMDDETWMTANEAVEHGFATSIIDGAGKTQAIFDLSVFSKVPKNMLWPDDTETPEPTKRDLERALTRDAGWTRSKARAAITLLSETDDTTRDAGEVDLTSLAEAVQAVSAQLNIVKEGK